MKKVFALLTLSALLFSTLPVLTVLLFQFLTVGMVSAQTAPEVKKIAQADLSSAKAYRDRGFSKSDAGDQQGATAEDGAQASLISIDRLNSILKMLILMLVGV